MTFKIQLTAEQLKTLEMQSRFDEERAKINNDDSERIEAEPKKKRS